MHSDDHGGWFIADAKPLGPLSDQQIVDRLKAGDVAGSAWLWTPGLNRWASARSVFKEMNLTPPTAPTVDVASTSAIAFRSLRLVAISLAIGAFVVGAFIAVFPDGYGSIAGVPAVIAGLAALAWMINEARGVRVTDTGLTVPARLPGSLRALSIFRRVISTDNELSFYCKRSLGFEIVVIRGNGIRETVLFDSARERRMFVDAVKRIFPGAQINREYRSAGLGLF
jgi:hypothetical protein